MSAASPPVSAALYYAAEGLAVFPCARGSKRPHGMLGERGGLHHASTTREIVKGWWGKDASASIGLNLGASGLIAFDFEGPAKGCDPVGIIAAVCDAYGADALPATWQALTPSGGRHLLYLAPTGDVPSTLPLEVPGLDRIRHGGSYVILPAVVAGEVVPDAEGRAWIDGPSPLTDAPSRPAPAPEWLADVADATARARRAARHVARTTGKVSTGADATPYGGKALRGLWGEVAHTGEGSRHGALMRAAVRARALEVGGHVTGAKWREVLEDAAARAGLPPDEVAGVLEWVAIEASQVEPAGPAREGRTP
jgi:hypothetical protein